MINLSNHPLVMRARFRSLFPEDSNVSFQFDQNYITVFIKDPCLLDLIPKTFEQISVRIIIIK